MATKRGKVRNGIRPYKLKNGSTRWQVVYRVNGKIHQKGGFTTKGAAERWRNTTRVSVDSGVHVNPSHGRTTFGQCAEEWLASRIDVRPTTKVRDEMCIRTYVLPTFANVQLRHIDHAMVRRWVADLQANGRVHGDEPLSASTVRKAYQSMAKVMKSAVLDRLIPVSPCHDVPLPRIEHEEARFLTPDELIALERAIAATEKQRYRKRPNPPRLSLIVPFLADTGLRIGEAAALRWKDVDVAAGSVHVRETFVEVRGTATVGQPKTKAGRRVVPMLTDVVGERLQERAERLGLAPDDYVWQGEDGGLLRPRLFRRRVWKPAIAVAGLDDPQPTPHALRHTAVAHWIAAGVTDRLKLMRLAGHQSTSIIDTVYGHLLPFETTEERQALARLRAEAEARAGGRHLRVVS